MKLLEALRVALDSLRANQLRALLATLGIAIGIAAISTLLSVGSSFQRFAQSQFAGLNADALTLNAQPDTSGQSGLPPERGNLSTADVKAITRVSGVREVVAYYIGAGELRAGTQSFYGNIIGAEVAFLRPTMHLILGRFLTSRDLEERARVVVLDLPTAQLLFPDGRPLGREIVVQGLDFRVIGVLSQHSTSGVSGAIVPMSVAHDRLFPESRLSGIQVSEASIYVNDLAQLNTVETAVTQLLRERHRLREDQGNDFSFQNYRQLAEANRTIMAGITAFLGRANASKSASQCGIREVYHRGWRQFARAGSSRMTLERVRRRKCAGRLSQSTRY